MARTCVRKADRNLPFDMRAIEAREHLELFYLFRVPIGRPVEVGQFFAGRNETGGEGDGFFQRLDRFDMAPFLSKTQAAKVVPVAESLVNPQRLVERAERAVDVAGAVPRQGKFVADAGRPIVETEITRVGFRRRLESLELIQGVPERFERPGGGRVEVRRGTEVPGGLVELGAALIGFSPPEVGKHGVGPERDGAAEGFNRDEGLLVVQSDVAAGQERLVRAVARRRLVCHGRRHGRDQRHANEEKPPHGLMLPAQRNFRLRPGSNGITK